jgi:hypothetical protein
MMSYYDGMSKDFVAAIKRGFALAASGKPFCITWSGREIKSLAEFHEWFGDNVNERINHKAGCRTDGASFKKSCHCEHCMGRCRCGIKKIVVDGILRCGYGCAYPWGGRKWENSVEMEAWRLSRKLRQPRLIIHKGEVPLEFRARFAHRIEEMQ